MLKVLFDSSIFLHQRRGGISKYIINLNRKLGIYNINSKIFSAISINEYLNNNNKNNKNQIAYFKLSRIPNLCTKFFFIINNFFFLIYLKYYKPDLVHFSYYNHHLASKLKIPYVVTVYDLIHENYKYENLQFSKKKILINAKHIICISNYTKHELIKKYKINKNKISTIYLGTDHKLNKQNKKDDIILFVGDRDRYKNFKRLLIAFGTSDFLKKNYRLVCIGGNLFNDEENRLIKKYNIKNKILQKFGDDKTLTKYYQKASLYISVSLNEGFGLTTIEAMRSGCVVLCSNIKVFREVLGNASKFFNPRDVKSIKNSIEKILKSRSDQKKLIKIGYKTASKYTWKKCAKRTSVIYKKISIEK
jgi:glycosyltransferase involved in cell wall biosynthesis